MPRGDLSAAPIFLLKHHFPGIPVMVMWAVSSAVQIWIGILFLQFVNQRFRVRLQTKEPASKYLLPAIFLALLMAAARYATHVELAPEHPWASTFGPWPARVTIEATISNGINGAVRAFILCGVIQEYLSRRVRQSFRLLGRDISLAVPAVAVIALFFPEIQALITAFHGGGIAGSLDSLFYGAFVFGYAFFYDRSKSIAAPVLAGSLYGILYGLLPVIFGGR